MTISKQKTTIQHIHDLGWWTIASTSSFSTLITFCALHIESTHNSYLISHISYLVSNILWFENKNTAIHIWWKPSRDTETHRGRVCVCVCALSMRIRSMNWDVEPLVVCLAPLRVSFLGYFVRIALWIWFILLIWKQVTMKCKDNRCHLKCDSCVSDKIWIVKGTWLNDACGMCVHVQCIMLQILLLAFPLLLLLVMLLLLL